MSTLTVKNCPRRKGDQKMAKFCQRSSRMTPKEIYRDSHIYHCSISKWTADLLARATATSRPFSVSLSMGPIRADCPK